MENNKLETISNLFEDSEIRSVWDSEKEEYYFDYWKIFVLPSIKFFQYLFAMLRKNIEKYLYSLF